MAAVVIFFLKCCALLFLLLFSNLGPHLLLQYLAPHCQIAFNIPSAASVEVELLDKLGQPLSDESKLDEGGPVYWHVVKQLSSKFSIETACSNSPLRLWSCDSDLEMGWLGLSENIKAGCLVHTLPWSLSAAL